MNWESQLKYRVRGDEGKTLVENDLLMWDEVLHRFDAEADTSSTVSGLLCISSLSYLLSYPIFYLILSYPLPSLTLSCLYLSLTPSLSHTHTMCSVPWVAASHPGNGDSLSHLPVLNRSTVRRETMSSLSSLEARKVCLEPAYFSGSFYLSNTMQ